MQDEAVALVAGDEVELDGAAPAADHRVVEAVRGGQDMALADQEARAVAAAAGIDAADGAPGVLHGVHLDPPLRRRDLQRRGEGGTGQPRQQQSRGRSEEHTSELQSLMRISNAVFCLKKKIKIS